MTTEKMLIEELASHLAPNTTAISHKPEELTFDIVHNVGGNDVRFRYRAIALKGLLCLEADLGIIVPTECAGCLDNAQERINEFHNDSHVCYGRFTISNGKIFYRLHQFFAAGAGPDELHWLGARTWAAASGDCLRFFSSMAATQACQGHDKVIPLRPKK